MLRVVDLGKRMRILIWSLEVADPAYSESYETSPIPKLQEDRTSRWRNKRQLRSRIRRCCTEQGAGNRD